MSVYVNALTVESETQILEIRSFKKKRVTDGPTDLWTDGWTHGPINGRTDGNLIEMCGRI